MALGIHPTPDHTVPRSVTVLGATGSVGCNTVNLLLGQRDQFRVEALTGNRNAKRLAEQARQLGARIAVVADPGAYRELREELWGSGIEAAAGADAVVEAAMRPSDFVMAAIVGTAGLAPTLAAVRRGSIVGLANKECLVSAGAVVMMEVDRCGATLVPVDSEHSAIYQVFDLENPAGVQSIILTASGGPFRTFDRATMAAMTPAQAVAHPNWSMGAKISVDSATMMNKGLELIEAFHLFPVDEAQIRIVVHPQSVIHSLVEYVDGSVLAQLGTPDMRTPIAYALAWPGRLRAPVRRLSLVDCGPLTFDQPDADRFPALRLAREALKIGGTAPTVLNASNEVAVQSFLTGRIGFLDIAGIVEEALQRLGSSPAHDLETVLDADQNARRLAETLVSEVDAPAAASG